VIPCGDLYANLLSQCGSELHEYFVFNTLDQALNRRLSLKSSFYETCEQYELPHPATKVVSAEGVSRGDYRELPFDYPVAMKPADSALWLDIDFPGRKKAFVINDPAELDTLIRRSYEAGYAGDMIIQDFIPGDDSRMRVLNAYVDQHHRVRMMFLGHPLLEDPTPEAVGNYAAIIPDYNEPIMLRIKDFLEDIGYQGVANFDMKYDERDGEYKLFEINLRPGPQQLLRDAQRLQSGALLRRGPSRGHRLRRSAAARARLEALDGDTPLDLPRLRARLARTSGADLLMIKRGDWGTTLEYRKDMNPTRWLMIRHMFSIYKKRYAQYFSHKEDLA
jgi:D-aspartate ligase